MTFCPWNWLDGAAQIGSAMIARLAGTIRQRRATTGEGVSTMKKIRALVLAAACMIPWTIAEGIDFGDLHGTWRLFYRGNYGYEFSFNRSYRANCVIYLQGSTLHFRGVYTIDEKRNLRINVSEMKHNEAGQPGGFTPISTSYFIFGAQRLKQSGKDYLELRPLTIIINGNNSEGYFEPVIKLAK